MKLKYIMDKTALVLSYLVVKKVNNTSHNMVCHTDSLGVITVGCLWWWSWISVTSPHLGYEPVWWRFICEKNCFYITKIYVPKYIFKVFFSNDDGRQLIQKPRIYYTEQSGKIIMTELLMSTKMGNECRKRADTVEK